MNDSETRIEQLETWVNAFGSENKRLTARLALADALAEAAGEAVRLCGLDGSLDRVEAALAAYEARNTT